MKWTPEQFWEYVEGLTSDRQAEQMREMMAECGLIVSAPQASQPQTVTDSDCEYASELLADLANEGENLSRVEKAARWFRKARVEHSLLMALSNAEPVAKAFCRHCHDEVSTVQCCEACGGELEQHLIAAPPVRSAATTDAPVDLERVAKSLASMMTEYVEGGINSNQNWRNGLNEIIHARLRRLMPSPSTASTVSPSCSDPNCNDPTCDYDNAPAPNASNAEPVAFLVDHCRPDFSIETELADRSDEGAYPVYRAAPPSAGNADAVRMRQLAEEYDAGSEKCRASGYEEFGDKFFADRKLVADALRFAALSAPVAGECFDLIETTIKELEFNRERGHAPDATTIRRLAAMLSRKERGGQ